MDLLHLLFVILLGIYPALGPVLAPYLDSLFAEQCGAGIDYDLDGLVDCADDECAGTPTCVEDCTDGIDNDVDGLTDCEDDECFGSPGCGEVDCQDGLDEDSDGLTDCEDPDCAGDAACAVSCRADALEGPFGNNTFDEPTPFAVPLFPDVGVESDLAVGGALNVDIYQPMGFLSADEVLEVWVDDDLLEIEVHRMTSGLCLPFTTCVVFETEIVATGTFDPVTQTVVVSATLGESGPYFVLVRGPAAQCVDPYVLSMTRIYECPLTAGDPEDDDPLTAPHFGDLPPEPNTTVLGPASVGFGDVDYGWVNVYAGQTALVSALPADTDQLDDFQLAVYAADADPELDPPLAIGASEGGQFQVAEVTATEDTELLIRVAEATDQVCVDLTLAGVYTICPTDGYDPNDDPSTPFDLDLVGSSVLGPLSTSPNDPDWFARTLAPGETFTVFVSTPSNTELESLGLAIHHAGGVEAGQLVDLGGLTGVQALYYNDTGAPETVTILVDADVACIEEYSLQLVSLFEECADAIDNDLDGLVDCEDDDCTGDPACVEECTDGVDNDLDGLADCGDPDCVDDAACAVPCRVDALEGPFGNDTFDDAALFDVPLFPDVAVAGDLAAGAGANVDIFQPVGFLSPDEILEVQVDDELLALELHRMATGFCLPFGACQVETTEIVATGTFDPVTQTVVASTTLGASGPYFVLVRGPAAQCVDPYVLSMTRIYECPLTAGDPEDDDPLTAPHFGDLPAAPNTTVLGPASVGFGDVDYGWVHVYAGQTALVSALPADTDQLDDFQLAVYAADADPELDPPLAIGASEGGQFQVAEVTATEDTDLLIRVAETTDQVCVDLTLAGVYTICPTDGYDPNDDPLTPFDLDGVDIDTSPDLGPLATSPNDPDWFARTLAPDEVLAVYANAPSDAETASLRLDLHHGGAVESAQVQGPAGQQVLGVTYRNDTGAPETVAILVGADVACVEEYALHLGHVLGQCDQDDPYEDNDTPATAWLVDTSSGPFTGDASVDETDDDFWSILVAPAETLQVDVSSPVLDTLDVTVLDDAWTGPDPEATVTVGPGPLPGSEVITAVWANDSATSVEKVVGFGDDLGCNPFQATVTLTAGPIPQCLDDFDPGDFESPALVGVPSVTTGLQVGGLDPLGTGPDADRFSYANDIAGLGHTFTFDVYPEAGASVADLAVSIWDSDGWVADATYDPSRGEFLRGEWVQQGSVSLSVWIERSGGALGCVEYSLEIARD